MAGLAAQLAPPAAAGVVLVVAGWARSRGPGRVLTAPDTTPPSAPDGRLHQLTRLSMKLRTWWSRRCADRRQFGPGDVAAWVDDLARSVRRGITLRQTIINTRPGHAALAASTEPLRHRLERGADVAAASSEWGASLGADRQLDRHLRSAASVLSISSSVGGGSAAPLDRLAAALRHTAADESERRAQSAQALISARVLTCVPVGLLALLVVLDADVRAVVRSPIGSAVVACGLVLNLFGGWWMRRIIMTASR